jgi:methylenetetrahydrofolate/methylenetetrahydromethanopterin dehydrogenase (NADP+)
LLRVFDSGQESNFNSYALEPGKPVKKILLQLDTDSQPSSFDSIVAIDSDVDHLLRYENVSADDVETLVHGAMFTRGGKDLARTAIFVGGGNVEAAEKLLKKIKSTFFGNVRVSVMLDANGCNTTSSAAVICAEKHIDMARSNVVVLAGTGPVGQRVALLCAKQGATVSVASRSKSKAGAVCEQLNAELANANAHPIENDSDDYFERLQKAHVVFSAGASGIQLLDETQWKSLYDAKVAIDLNAVPPGGICSVEVTDRATERDGIICYGAIGVGALKMKIHRAALAKLFESNDQILEIEEIYNSATAKFG